MNSQPDSIELQHIPPVYIGRLSQAKKINQHILEQYQVIQASPEIRRSHHFMGRFENTYIPESMIPAIKPVLALGQNLARQILQSGNKKLKMCFWFNEMQPGHVTTLHTHEENEELLSAVYYIQADPDSGALIVRDGFEKIEFQPQAGRMILFAPQVPHEVTVNNSNSMRLSVAINYGY
jgi:predicted 2-oxoglutarate/Fe(II)-dependent dioxygenase YbiX